MPQFPHLKNGRGSAALTRPQLFSVRDDWLGRVNLDVNSEGVLGHGGCGPGARWTDMG